ncbi:MAG: ABC transporter permease subunit [Candidatus Latescibacteria bacterium]|jgi:ABC-type transport system involved in multi-copper enzyme maturation permease subunit|nr:ABC transporter permease subunit [Candidatus Latescibacterota bacterium]
MILTIILKEFHQHLISFRFVVCFILSVILIGVSVYYRSANYSERLKDYNGAVINSRNELEQIEALSFLQPKVHRPPSQGSVFVEGIEGKLDTEVTISHHHIPVEAAGGKAINQFAATSRVFDFSDVVIIVLSLLAFLLSYDVVSGEKERGLLGLSLSNSIPRHQILLGKYLGGLLPLILSIAAGMLVCFLIMLLAPDIQITWDLTLRTFLFMFASVVFLSLMLLLGIIVSSTTRQSFISLIFLLFIWVLFVFIVPRAAQYSALQLKTVTSKRGINEQIAQLKNEMNGKIDEHKKTINPQRLNAAMTGDGKGNLMLTTGFNPPQTVEYFRQHFAYAGPLQIDYAQRFWNVERQHIDDLDKQADFARALSTFSPTSIYKRLSATVTGTDRANHESFLNAARRYRLGIIDYIESQGGFSSDLYFMQYDYNPSVVEIRLSNEFAPIHRKAMAIFRSGQRDGSEEIIQEFVEKLQKLRQYGKDHPNEARKPDISGMPIFRFTPPDFLYDVKRSMAGIGLLIFFNILGFLVAHVAFLKYDVR